MSIRLGHAIYAGALWLAYPLILYWGLRWGSPRIVGVLILTGLVLRRRHDVKHLLGDFDWLERGILMLMLLHAALSALANSEQLVRLFPVSMNAGVFTVFARSLFQATSMVERFARLKQPDLPPQGVTYTRRVTQVWCGFLAINTVLSLWTATQSSREVWALYNGFVVYLLMGGLFAGEWVFRTYWLRKKHVTH